MKILNNYYFPPHKRIRYENGKLYSPEFFPNFCHCNKREVRLHNQMVQRKSVKLRLRGTGSVPSVGTKIFE